MALILAVDDSISIRNLYKRTLGEDGHDVIVAEDGYVAIELARARAFDMVLSDINMPKMNGIDLTARLRKLENYGKIPIIMATTENEEHQKQRAKILGANGWLQKPFTRERLLNVVTVMLEKYSKAS